MDKEKACHAIALETAKAFVSCNMPEYINSTGSAGHAKDMAEKYIDAYKIAEKVFNDPKNIQKAKIRNKSDYGF